MNNKLTVKKILMEDFIRILTELYNDGIDCVSMTVEKGEHQDSIYFSEYKPVDNILSTTESKQKNEIKNVEDFL
jgi:hypothetical protein